MQGKFGRQISLAGNGRDFFEGQFNVTDAWALE